MWVRIIMDGMKAATVTHTNGTVSPLSTRREWSPEDIAVQAAGGNRLALEVMYRQYAPFLTNMLTRMIGNNHGADDVVQETFILAFQKIGMLKEPAALKTWLCRIAVNELRKRERKKKFLWFGGNRNKETDAALEALAVSDASPDVYAELRRIDALLSNVDSEWRLAWMLRRVEGMTVVETARIMGCSQATVKRYVAAVNAALKLDRKENSHD